MKKFLFALLLSLLIQSTGNILANQYQNPLYCMAGLERYNIKNVTNIEEYLFEQKNKLALDALWTQLKTMPSCWELGVPLGLTVLGLGITSANKIIQNSAGTFYISKLPQLLVTAGSWIRLSLLWTILTKGLGKGKTAWDIYNYETNYPSNPLEELEIEYLKIKNQIPKDWQEKIEELFLNAYCSSQEPNKKPIQQISFSLKFIKKNILNENALTIENYDPEKIEEIIDNYSNATFSAIDLFCATHLIQSTNPDNTIKMNRNIAYFQGAPGVGKTRAAKLLAKALNVDYIEIDLNKFDFTSDLLSTSKEPGQIVQLLSTKPNSIIVLNDADRILNNPQMAIILPSILNQLFDPEVTEIYDPYLEKTIDFSKLGIILTGNNPITDSGLRDRLNIVYFPGYNSKEKKQRLYKSFIPELLKKFKFELNKEDETIIDGLLNLDHTPGLRKMQNKITAYLNKKYICTKIPTEKKQNICIKKAQDNMIEENEETQGYQNQADKGFLYYLSTEDVQAYQEEQAKLLNDPNFTKIMQTLTQNSNSNPSSITQNLINKTLEQLN